MYSENHPHELTDHRLRALRVGIGGPIDMEQAKRWYHKVSV